MRTCRCIGRDTDAITSEDPALVRRVRFCRAEVRNICPVDTGRVGDGLTQVEYVAARLRSDQELVLLLQDLQNAVGKPYRVPVSEHAVAFRYAAQKDVELDRGPRGRLHARIDGAQRAVDPVARAAIARGVHVIPHHKGRAGLGGVFASGPGLQGQHNEA